jgi:hypothetical protein
VQEVRVNKILFYSILFYSILFYSGQSFGNIHSRYRVVPRIRVFRRISAWSIILCFSVKYFHDVTLMVFSEETKLLPVYHEVT